MITKWIIAQNHTVASCIQDFIARKINVNNYHRNLIKSRLENVTCRSDALWKKISLRHSGKKEDLGSAGLWRQNSPWAAGLNAEGPEKLRESGESSGFTMNMKPECVKNSLSLQFYPLPTSSLLMNANF